MITIAARIEGISKAQYLREGAIMRAGFTFAEATHRQEIDELKHRIAALERRAGRGPAG